MAIFAIVTDKESDAVRDRIAEEFEPKDFYKVSAHAWLIRSSLTTSEIAEKAGLAKDDLEEIGLVLRISAYSGLEIKDTWEWLESRWNT